MVLKKCAIKVDEKYLKIGLLDYTENIEEAQIFYSKSQAKRIMSDFKSILQKQLGEEMFRKLKIIVVEI